MDRKLRILQGRILKLSVTEKVAFDAAVIMGRGFTPSRVLNTVEWGALWGLHPAITDRQARVRIEDLADEIIILSPADYLTLTGPQPVNRTKILIKGLVKKAVAALAIIIACTALTIGVVALVTTLVSNSTIADSLGSLHDVDKSIHEDVAKVGAKADTALAKANEAVGQADSAVGKAESAEKKAASAVSKANTANAKAESAIKKAEDVTKTVQTLVGVESDGIIGSKTEKAVEKAAKVLAQTAPSGETKATIKPKPSLTPTPKPDPTAVPTSTPTSAPTPKPDPTAAPTSTPAQKPTPPSVPTVIPKSAPVVSVGNVYSTKTVSVTVSGKVNPNGSATTCWVEYGKSKSNLKPTDYCDIGDGKKAKTVLFALENLDSSTAYYYQLVADNGTKICSEFKTFTTAAISKPVIIPTPSPSPTTPATPVATPYYVAKCVPENVNGINYLVVEFVFTGDLSKIAQFTYEIDSVRQPWATFQGTSPITVRMERPSGNNWFCPVVKMLDGTPIKGTSRQWIP